MITIRRLCVNVCVNRWICVVKRVERPVDWKSESIYHFCASKCNDESLKSSSGTISVFTASWSETYLGHQALEVSRA